MRAQTKSAVAVIAIKAGEVITAGMVTAKGPGTGLSPMRIEKMVGKKAAKDIAADTMFQEDDIAWG